MTEYEFIQAEKARFPVRAMCKALGASKSGYYERRSRGPSERLKRRDELSKTGRGGARILAANVRQPPSTRSSGAARRGCFREDGSLGHAGNRPRGATTPSLPWHD